MLNRHVGYYFLPIIPCAGCVRLVADGLLPACVNASLSVHLVSMQSKCRIAYMTASKIYPYQRCLWFR